MYNVLIFIQGQFCQQCKPLYVGDPRNGGKCVSCTSFCHEHSDVCLYYTQHDERKAEINELLRRYPNTRSDEFVREVKPALLERICLS